jgi:hypothetical protein
METMDFDRSVHGRTLLVAQHSRAHSKRMCPGRPADTQELTTELSTALRLLSRSWLR